jgi:hypothetical protein
MENMMNRTTEWTFVEFLDALSSFNDDPDQAIAWVHTLPVQQRDRLLKTFLVAHEARMGSKRARLKLRRLERRERRLVEQSTLRRANGGTR